MQEFTCVYEVRSGNAIGAWQKMSSVVEATSVKQAMESCRQQLNNNGFQTRFPVSCNGLSGESLRKELQ